MGLRGTSAGLLLVVAALCATLGTTGCGGGDSDDASAQDSQDSAGPAIPKSPPGIEVPEGLPPEKLVVKDMREGTGTEAEKGDTVQIHYYGVQWEEGAEHASSWTYENIPVFTLGKPPLLYALGLAIPGMKEGGSREVTIPHNLVYYPKVKHRPLGRLSALIYKVYLVKVLSDDKDQRG